MKFNFLLINTKTNFFAASPLDQFGSDDDGLAFFDIFLSFLGKRGYNFLELFGLLEIFDLSNYAGILMISGGFLLFDDEDAADSEWEENDAASVGMQSSILSANLIGMLPGVDTVTAEAALAFLFSISTIVTIVLLGISLHSVRFFSIIYPSGTPTLMIPFIIVIEFISYISRAVSLGMRLFANMFAGHSLVKILMSFGWLFLNSALPVLGIPVYALLVVIFFMEVGIAYLQSYVFSALSSMYLEDAIALGH